MYHGPYEFPYKNVLKQTFLVTTLANVKPDVGIKTTTKVISLEYFITKIRLKIYLPVKVQVDSPQIIFFSSIKY